MISQAPRATHPWLALRAMLAVQVLASMILSIVGCVGGFFYIRLKESAWQARHDELSARINLLVLEESRHRRSMSEVLDEREVKSKKRHAEDERRAVSWV